MFSYTNMFNRETPPQAFYEIPPFTQPPSVTSPSVTSSPAPAVSLHQWAETEASNQDAQETIRHLKEVVIPNLQERQKLQNEHWGKLWNEIQAENTQLKKNAETDSEFLDNLQVSFQEQNTRLIAVEERNKLLENGVTRARNQRKDKNFYKKENKQLKTEITQAISWRDYWGAHYYDQNKLVEEEQNKRQILMEKNKKLEEKLELVSQNLTHCENHLDAKNTRIEKLQNAAVKIRAKLHSEWNEKNELNDSATSNQQELCRANNQISKLEKQQKFILDRTGKKVAALKENLEKANNEIDEYKQQIEGAREINEHWNSKYTELSEKYEVLHRNVNEESFSHSKNNNIIHIYPKIPEDEGERWEDDDIPSPDHSSSSSHGWEDDGFQITSKFMEQQKEDNKSEVDDEVVYVPERAGIGWISENRNNGKI